VISVEPSVEFSLLLIRQSYRLGNLGDGVPNILNELNPFRYAQTKDVPFRYHVHASSNIAECSFKLGLFNYLEVVSYAVVRGTRIFGVTKKDGDTGLLSTGKQDLMVDPPRYSSPPLLSYPSLLLLSIFLRLFSMGTSTGTAADTSWALKGGNPDRTPSACTARPLGSLSISLYR
jgi:hypothetical protein